MSAGKKFKEAIELLESLLKIPVCEELLMIESGNI